MAIKKFRKGWDGNIPEMTHSQLVSRAFEHLRMSEKCKVCFQERIASTRETPDAIGYKSSFSILIECKASRSDFLADKKKWFRKRPESGMGYERYMMAPVGMLHPDEMPGGWGLLEVYEKDKRGYRSVSQEKRSESFFERNLQAELSYMVSAVRRIQISMAVFVESADK